MDKQDGTVGVPILFFLRGWHTAFGDFDWHTEKVISGLIWGRCADGVI